ncbi:MAG: hypothetical protein ACPGU5_05645 [Lishizhenia sp.]
MKFIGQHLIALKKVLQLIFSGRYIAFFLPGIVIAISYFFIVELFSSWFGLLDNLSYIPWIGDEIQKGVSFIGKWSNSVSYFIFQFIILTLFSPFNTLLGEKLDYEISNQKIDGGFGRILSDLVRMIGILIIGLLFDFCFFIIWNLTIGSLFNVEFLSPYLSLVIGSFWLGFSFYDFALERKQINIGKSYSFALKNFFHTVLTGLLFSALMLIPYIGIVIAPVLITMLSTFNYYNMTPPK